MLHTTLALTPLPHLATNPLWLHYHLSSVTLLSVFLARLFTCPPAQVSTSISAGHVSITNCMPQKETTVTILITLTPSLGLTTQAQTPEATHLFIQRWLMLCVLFPISFIVNHNQDFNPCYSCSENCLPSFPHTPWLNFHPNSSLPSLIVWAFVNYFITWALTKQCLGLFMVWCRHTHLQVYCKLLDDRNGVCTFF